MKSSIKKILIGFLVLLGAVILFLAIRLFTLPRLDPSYTYHGNEYGFISGKYGTLVDHHTAKTGKAVARFYDAFIYTKKDDPDEFYLIPKVFLAHLPYNVLGRRDMMQLPSEENVDHIEVCISNGEDVTWNALDSSTQNSLLGAYGKSTIDPKEYENTNMIPVKESWQAEEGCEVFDVRIWFKKPNDLYYELMIIKRDNEYYLLLEDGMTLIGFDGSLLQQ
ncbi:MAG: hypothetical protein J5544_06260 [Clostridia bacterium]|nr:hypothetical protein [Clostridia bacterium]